MSESLSPDEVFEKIAKGSSAWRNLVPSQEHDRFVGRVQQAVQIYQGLVSPKDLRSELKAFKKATRSPSAPISQLVSELSAEAQDMLSHSRPLPPPPDNPSASEAYYNDIRLRLSQGQRWKPEGDKRRKLTKVVGPPKREGRPPDQKIDVLVSLISAAYAYATGTSTYGSRGDDLPETPVEQIVGDILANLGIDTEHSAKKAVQRHIERRRAL